jgi:hypothetical protein
MIPAHSSLKFQNDPNAFPGLVLELHTPLTGGIGPVAPTRDNSADLEYSVAWALDGGGSHARGL